jgi:ABC-type lipoprotein release transport system permease subunit
MGPRSGNAPSMTLVWMRVRSELRHRWRMLVVLAVVVGIGGGASIAALAGAQRTDTAVPEFLSYALPDDGGFLFGNVFSPPSVSGPPDSLALAPAEQKIVDLPQVAAYFRAPYLFLTSDPSGHNADGFNVIGDADPDLYRSVDRPLVLAGRLPDPHRRFEVAVNELAASARHLHVGSSLRLYAMSYAQVSSGDITASSATPIRPAGPSYVVHVTGIVRFPQDVNAVVPLLNTQGVAYESQRNLYTTPAFLQQLARGLGIPVSQVPAINLVALRLHHGAADWKAFSRSVAEVSASSITVGSPGNVEGMRQAAASAQRGIRLDVAALIAFGLLVALVTILFVAQAFGRQVYAQAPDYLVLRSLGAARGQVVSVVLVLAALVGAAGAALAVAVAFAASPLMPVGLARQAEIHAGFDANIGYFALGFAILVTLVTLAALVPALRVSRPTKAAEFDDRRARAGWLAGLAGRATSPVASIGMRFGLESRAGTAASTASGLVTAVVAVVTLTAALTFAASLNQLISSPRDQGWNWDALVGNPNDQADHEAQEAALLSRNPDVRGYASVAIIAGASQGTAVIDHHVIDFLIALDPGKGQVHPTLIAGHAPRASDQIVLATKTMQLLHRQIGQDVHVPTPAGDLTLRVVGQMIAPSVGDLFTNNMGDGAWVYGPAIHAQEDAQPQQQNGLPPTVFNMFLVRYADGVSPSAGLVSLQRQFGHDVLRHVPPEDVVNLQNVDRLPFVLTGLVVVLAVATVGNALMVSIRRRRRDLAILKTMGFLRRQVAGVVAWQATSMGLAALAIGVPVGVAAGRWGWNTVATQIGSAAPPVVPLLALAVLVPAVLVAVNVIAGVPGWSAARIAPARAMRAE